MGGLQLPLALTELGLIDEYELVVHPRLAGHGPTLFVGYSKQVDLKPLSRLEFHSGGSGDAVRAEKVAIGLAIQGPRNQSASDRPRRDARAAESTVSERGPDYFPRSSV